MMNYRVGRWTTGFALVLLGIMILLSQATDFDGFGLASKLWPLVLIGYGLEYLFQPKKTEKVRFDVFGAILVTIAFVGLISFNFFSGFDGFSFNGIQHKFQDEPVVVSSEGIASFYASTKNGKVLIQPSTDNQVSIAATYRITAIDEKQALEKKEKIRLDVHTEGNKLVAEVVYPNKSIVNLFGESVELTVYLPKEIAVESKSSNGTIEIVGMDNVKSAKTSNGSIVLTDSKSDHAVLDTSNGRIEVNRFIGGLDADTSNGKIIVKGDVTGDWRLETSNGSIEADVPANGSYQYTFSTSNGKIHATNPPFTNRNNSNKKVEGSVNGGQYKLDFRTSNGSITVEVR